MAEIRLEGVAHSYDGGKTYALNPITMTWKDGKATKAIGRKSVHRWQGRHRCCHRR
jgi:hypothetical protein